MDTYDTTRHRLPLACLFSTNTLQRGEQHKGLKHFRLEGPGSPLDEVFSEHLPRILTLPRTFPNRPCFAPFAIVLDPHQYVNMAALVASGLEFCDAHPPIPEYI